MSSHSRKAREKFTPEPVEQRRDDHTSIDAWVPDYGRECANCGETPCVNGVANGCVVYEGELCGPCTWGDAAAANSANW